MSFSKVVTPYELPFEVWVQPAPLLSDGAATLAVKVELEVAPSEKARQALDIAMMHFSSLAEAGALGGDTIPPWESTLSTCEGPVVHGQMAEWTLAGSRLDERSLAILVNLFLAVAETFPLKRLSVEKKGEFRPSARLESDPDENSPYPPAWKQIPFALEIDEEAMDSVCLSVTFAKKLSKSEQESLADELYAWAGPTCEGAYAIAPLSPSDAGMIPDFPIEPDQDSLDWYLEKFRADRGAFDGLVNVLVSIHHKLAPIREASIG